MAPVSKNTSGSGKQSAFTLPPARQTEIREAFARAAREAGGMVNPRVYPPGIGEFQYLQPADAQLADELGYTSWADILSARAAGALDQGLGPNTGPAIVWYPAAEFLNPDEQPKGEGTWHFLSSGSPNESDDGLAAINFGGQHNLPAQPSAGQIFRLRQLLRADPEREDSTRELDLIWVPGTPSPDEDEADPVLDPLDPDRSPRDPPFPVSHPPASGPEPAASGVPAALAHFDPTNGGVHNQLGGPQALYDCRAINGHWVTVDRSRLVVGHPEPHKLWVHSVTGWRQYGHAATLDYKDAKAVEKVNKFREQVYQRGGWPPLREATRKDYSQEQREWALGLVDAAGGERPAVSGEDLLKAFEEKWPGQKRSVAAMGSLMDRMRLEWQKSGKVLLKRKERGWWQKERGKKMRDEQIDDEKALTEGEGDGEGDGDEGGDEDEEGEGETEK